jgi:hypothetical protein
MSTLIAVGILIVIGFSGQLLWLTVLNLAGVPGALIGGGFRREAGVGANHSWDNVICSWAVLRLPRLRRARCDVDQVLHPSSGAFSHLCLAGVLLCRRFPDLLLRGCG